MVAHPKARLPRRLTPPPKRARQRPTLCARHPDPRRTPKRSARWLARRPAVEESIRRRAGGSATDTHSVSPPPPVRTPKRPRGARERARRRSDSPRRIRGRRLRSPKRPSTLAPAAPSARSATEVAPHGGSENPPRLRCTTTAEAAAVRGVDRASHLPPPPKRRHGRRPESTSSGGRPTAEAVDPRGPRSGPFVPWDPASAEATPRRSPRRATWPRERAGHRGGAAGLPGSARGCPSAILRSARSCWPPEGAQHANWSCLVPRTGAETPSRFAHRARRHERKAAGFSETRRSGSTLIASVRPKPSAVSSRRPPKRPP